MNADTVTALEAAQAEFEGRILAKRGELDALGLESSAIVDGLLADGTPESRKRLLRQRSELANEIAAVDDEVAELCSRRDMAELARYQLVRDALRSELDALVLASTDARRKMQAFSLVRLRFMNSGGRRPDSEEAEAARIENDYEWAKICSASAIATARTEKAKGRWEAAERELAGARARLGMT